MGWWKAADPKVSSVGVWGYSNEQKKWSCVVKLDIEPDEKEIVSEVRLIILCDKRVDETRPVCLYLCAMLRCKNASTSA